MKDGAELQQLLRAALAQRPEQRETYVREHVSGDSDTTEHILALLEEMGHGPDVGDLNSLVFGALNEGAAAGQARTDFLRVAFQLDVIQRLLKTPDRDRGLIDSLLLSLSTLAGEETIDPEFRDAIGLFLAVRVAEREGTIVDRPFVE